MYHNFIHKIWKKEQINLDREDREPCLPGCECDKSEHTTVEVWKSRSDSHSGSILPSKVISPMVSHSGRTFVKTVLKLLFKLTISLWKLASSFAIIIFFASWYYGGILPYLVAIVALLSLGYHFSDSLLYQPEAPAEARVYVPSPSLFSLPFETVFIQTTDRIKLHSYLIKQTKSLSSPTIIYFHGNAGNIGHRLENARQIYNKTKCNILMVEYRGYGLSEGSPSEQGFYRDAQSAYEFVENRDDLDTNKIILFGRSLGGAVAIDLASRNDFRDRILALIVENTFTSIPNLAKHLFPIRLVHYLPSWCYKNRYESVKKMANVTCSTLFISGLKDELIPPRMMTELYGRCSSMRKEFVKIQQGTHNDTWTIKGYINHVSNFVEQVVERGPPQTYKPFNDNIV